MIFKTNKIQRSYVWQNYQKLSLETNSHEVKSVNSMKDNS